jgi:hypothetical protein
MDMIHFRRTSNYAKTSCGIDMTSYQNRKVPTVTTYKMVTCKTCLEWLWNFKRAELDWIEGELARLREESLDDVP